MSTALTESALQPDHPGDPACRVRIMIRVRCDGDARDGHQSEGSSEYQSHRGVQSRGDLAVR